MLEAVGTRPKKSKRVVVRGDGSTATALSKSTGGSRKRSPDEIADEFGRGLIELVEFLVSCGHREADVLTYTLKKATVYADVANTRMNAATLSTAVAMRVSQATEDGWKKYTEQLTRER